jgi:hypothetical protein
MVIRKRKTPKKRVKDLLLGFSEEVKRKKDRAL